MVWEEPGSPTTIAKYHGGCVGAEPRQKPLETCPTNLKFSVDVRRIGPGETLLGTRVQEQGIEQGMEQDKNKQVLLNTGGPLDMIHQSGHVSVIRELPGRCTRKIEWEPTIWKRA